MTATAVAAAAAAARGCGCNFDVATCSKAVGNKTQEEKQKIKPSEILTYVFSDEFFNKDLSLKSDEVTGFLEYIDDNLPSQKLLKTGQQFQLIDYLISESQNYRDKLNTR